MDGDPQDLGGCVNVDRICTDCTAVIGVTSWTKAAWLERHAKVPHYIVLKQAKGSRGRVDRQS